MIHDVPTWHWKHDSAPRFFSRIQPTPIEWEKWGKYQSLSKSSFRQSDFQLFLRIFCKVSSFLSWSHTFSMWPLCHQSEIVVLLKPHFFPKRGRFLGGFVSKKQREAILLLMVQKSGYPVEVGSWNPIIYKVLYIPGRAGFPSTVFGPQNSESSFSQLIPTDFLQGTAGYIPTIAQWHHRLLRVLRADPRLIDLLHSFPFTSFKDGNRI